MGGQIGARNGSDVPGHPLQESESLVLSDLAEPIPQSRSDTLRFLAKKVDIRITKEDGHRNAKGDSQNTDVWPNPLHQLQYHEF